MWRAGHWLYAVEHHVFASSIARRLFERVLPAPLNPTRGRGVRVVEERRRSARARWLVVDEGFVLAAPAGRVATAHEIYRGLVRCSAGRLPHMATIESSRATCKAKIRWETRRR